MVLMKRIKNHTDFLFDSFFYYFIGQETFRADVTSAYIAVGQPNQQDTKSLPEYQ